MGVRQALARLRAEGRIYSRKGSGNFVGERVSAAPSSPTFGPLTSVPDMQALLEFRLLLEGECAARAAIHREPSQRERIRTRRRQFERAVAKGAAGIDEDIAFHVAIAEASDNRFLIATLAAIRDHARSGIQLVRDLSARSPTERMAEVCREHAAIEAAISEGQAEGARRAMTAHLARGIQRLFGK